MKYNKSEYYTWLVISAALIGLSFIYFDKTVQLLDLILATIILFGNRICYILSNNGGEKDDFVE